MWFKFTNHLGHGVFVNLNDFVIVFESASQAALYTSLCTTHDHWTVEGDDVTRLKNLLEDQIP